MGPIPIYGLVWGLAAIATLWLSATGLVVQPIYLALLWPRRPGMGWLSWLGAAAAGPLAATLIGAAALKAAFGGVSVDARTLDSLALLVPLVAFLLWALLDVALFWLVLRRGGGHPGAPQGASDSMLQQSELNQVRALRPISPEAILALVLAAVGFFLWCSPASLVAICFAIKVRRQEREQGDPRSRNAVMSLVAIVVATGSGVFCTLGYLGILWLRH